jgi:hypothetical protein
MRVMRGMNKCCFVRENLNPWIAVAATVPRDWMLLNGMMWEKAILAAQAMILKKIRRRKIIADFWLFLRLCVGNGWG